MDEFSEMKPRCIQLHRRARLLIGVARQHQTADWGFTIVREQCHPEVVFWPLSSSVRLQVIPRSFK